MSLQNKCERGCANFHITVSSRFRLLSTFLLEKVLTQSPHFNLKFKSKSSSEISRIKSKFNL